jgi:guanine nucleotide-binding protein subunit beta-2-like 1 protein
MAEQLVLRGTLEGHTGWVTSLATSLEKYVEQRNNMAA